VSRVMRWFAGVGYAISGAEAHDLLVETILSRSVVVSDRDCDRCHNKVRYTRTRTPADPATFCDTCHRETGL
jgi:hypothetical protein